MAKKRNINGENEREKTRENTKKFFVKFYGKKQRERERERERPVIKQRGKGEGSDYQRRVVVGDWMSDHRASTYRRR